MPTATPLNWVKSRSIGQVSEIAVLSPIKLGRVPGERRTYEERLRSAIDNLTARVQQGIPIELDRIRTIHFGRMIIVRPEQYLVYSDVPGVQYDETAKGKIPKPIDDYVPLEAAGGKPPTLRSSSSTVTSASISATSRSSSPTTSMRSSVIAKILERRATSKGSGPGSSDIRSTAISSTRAMATSRWCASSNSRNSSVASTSSSPRCGRQTDRA
jgi:hypothetical protein